MEYRLGATDDLDAICDMVASVIHTMEAQGIYQWDAMYPTREDFLADLQQQTLYMATEQDVLVAIYVINRECDPEYQAGKWQYCGEKAGILHRLCVSPKAQHHGVGKAVLAHIEQQLRDMGVTSVRLDVFSENPYAIRLYKHNGYVQRGHVDWRKGRFFADGIAGLGGVIRYAMSPLIATFFNRIHQYLLQIIGGFFVSCHL